MIGGNHISSPLGRVFQQPANGEIGEPGDEAVAGMSEQALQRSSMVNTDPGQSDLTALLRREHRFPVLLHIDDNPALGISLVEGLIQHAYMAFAVVGIFAIRIGVVNE